MGSYLYVGAYWFFGALLYVLAWAVVFALMALPTVVLLWWGNDVHANNVISFLVGVPAGLWLGGWLISKFSVFD